MAPTVSWNISPAVGMPYKCREGDIVPLPRYFFKVCSKFGSCHLGEVYAGNMIFKDALLSMSMI